MKIQCRYFLPFVFILSLDACSSGDLPYPNLSSVPEKPLLRLTPQSQNELKDNLQNDWHIAEEKQKEVQNATEQPTEETHVPIPSVSF